MNRKGEFLLMQAVTIAIFIAACIGSTYGATCTEPPDEFVGRFKISLVQGREVDIAKDGLTATGPTIPPGPSYIGSRAFWELNSKLPFERIDCTSNTVTVIFGQKLAAAPDERGYQCLTLRKDGASGNLVGMFVYDPRITADTKDKIDCSTLGQRRKDDYFIRHELEALFTRTNPFPKITVITPTEVLPSTTIGTMSHTGTDPATGTTVTMSHARLVSSTVNTVTTPTTPAPTTSKCIPGFCYNGGTCLDDSTGPTCKCATSFTGPRCSTKITVKPKESKTKSEAKLGQERNDHVVNERSPIIAGISAHTGAPATSTRTVTGTLKCSPDYCKNGGICSDSSTGPTCACRIPFTGQTCTERFNPCSTNPCASFSASCKPDLQSPLGYVCQDVEGTVTEDHTTVTMNKPLTLTDGTPIIVDRKAPLNDKTKVVAACLASVMLVVIFGGLCVYVRSLTTRKFRPHELNEFDIENNVGGKLLRKSVSSSQKKPQVRSDLNNNNNVIAQQLDVPCVGVISNRKNKCQRDNQNNKSTMLYERRKNWRHKSRPTNKENELTGTKKEADRTKNTGYTPQTKQFECTTQSNDASIQRKSDCLKERSPRPTNENELTGTNKEFNLTKNTGNIPPTKQFGCTTQSSNASKPSLLGKSECLKQCSPTHGFIGNQGTNVPQGDNMGQFNNEDKIPLSNEDTMHFPPISIEPYHSGNDSDNAMDYLVDFIENNYPNE